MELEEKVTLATQEISAFLERTAAFLEGNGVEPAPAYHVALIFEEILVNVAMHGGDANGTAAVRIVIEPGQVLGEIVDAGRPFDPSQAKEPNVTAPIAQRPVGGLGLFLVRRVSSAFATERVGSLNRTTFAVPRAAPPAPEHP